jgi:hypothetical protein
MLPIDFRSFTGTGTLHVAISHWFRAKEVMRHGIASFTRLRMTNEGAGREGAAKWKWEMKLFRLEDWTSPAATMSECDWAIGVVGYRAIHLHESTYYYPQ